MQAAQVQRNCGFRGEIEPKSLRWESTTWDSEDDPHGKLLGLENAHYRNPERKNHQMPASRPRRDKNEHKRKTRENKKDMH